MATSAEALPRRLKLTVDDYRRMVEAGIVDERRRVELIDGEIIEMPPIGPRHLNLVNRLTRALVLAVGERAVVSVQNPVLLPAHSEPEPDLVLFDPGVESRGDVVPGAADALLVVEVADSTLRHDRDVKVPLYARHDVPEVWLVEVQARSLVRYRTPREGGYASRDVPRLAEPIAPAALPEVTLDLSHLFDG